GKGACKLRRLRGSQAIEEGRGAACRHSRAGEACPGPQRPRSARPFSAGFYPADLHGIDVLPLPKRAAWSNETDLREGARTATERSVRDCIREPVDETGER